MGRFMTCSRQGDDRLTEHSSRPYPPNLPSEIRSALGRFYDYAFLSQHPLLGRVCGPTGGSSSSRAVQNLRRALIDAIERLHPKVDTADSDPAWRPYLVLHHRYILGKEWEEVASELGLSVRQLQREQSRALEAIATDLWEQWGAGDGNAEEPAGGALWQEISRVAEAKQAFDAGPQIERAIASLEALADRFGVAIRSVRPAAHAVVGDPTLYRQLIVAMLSYAIRRMALGSTLTVDLRSAPHHAVCTLRAGELTAPREELRMENLPEAVTALAQAQNAEIDVSGGADGWTLSIRSVAAERTRVVALVEDNQDMVALFSRILSAAGYHLVGFSDSEAVVERLADLMPDAIVLDVMMRGVDGWEILQQLKADPRTQQIPVAICSVLDEPELARSLGADSYILKPVRPARLQSCLAELLHET